MSPNPSRPLSGPSSSSGSSSSSSSSSSMPPPPSPPPRPSLLRIPSATRIPMPPSRNGSSLQADTKRAFSYSHPERASPGMPHTPPPSPLYSPTPVSPRASGIVPESPIARSRRTPSPARTPPMRVHSTAVEHTLTVRLPEGLAPEMVTVCAKKGARLSVVADLWHLESDSHYEWEVAFAPLDVDMMTVRAVFEPDGRLVIHVRRRSCVDGLPSPKVCNPY
ncbi:hypothetical protein C8Q77DRAFT_1071575 [Trametes polyzona]|nr:hypothetical protein C8Q77DRAFT_1071575 [Trametes polyzona]